MVPAVCMVSSLLLRMELRTLNSQLTTQTYASLPILRRAA
jgi:hypothetical protein